MKHKYFIFIMILLIGVFLMAGCGGGDDLNTAPVISSNTPEDTEITVSKAQVVDFSISAKDKDNDSLNYTWAKSGGTFTSQDGNSVSWIAPEESGDYTVKVIVSDGKESTSLSWEITVIDNNAPIINSKTPESTTIEVQTDETIAFAVVVSEPDGDEINYKWEESGDGTFLNKTENAATWVAPSEGGNATVKVIVSDDKGGSTYVIWDIIIKENLLPNEDPVIDTKDPQDSSLEIVTGETKKFKVTASDPDNDPLTYSWSQTGNGTITETAHENEINWTAGDEAEEIRLTVTVTDNKGGSTSFAWDINVKEKLIVNITENIETSTTWKSGRIYRIEKGYFKIDGTLTIEPGTIIKFTSIGNRMETGENGKILAKGTSDLPIIFTSDFDNEHGGNTSGDNTQAAAGDWRQIYLQNNNSVFEYCEFYYGGDANALINVARDNTIIIKNSIFANNGKVDSFVLNLINANPDSIIQDNIFYANEKPMNINSNLSLDNSNKFSNPKDSNERNIYDAIFVGGGEVINQTTWSESEVGFVINNQLKIRSDAVLNLNGVVLKFQEYGKLNSSGKLIAEDVVFTAYNDDNYGGNSNGRNNDGTLERGYWNQIFLNGSNSSLINCKILYASNKAVESRNKVTIENNSFAYNSGYALDLKDSALASSIKENIFYDNEMPMIINANMSIDDSNTFSQSGITNDKNGIFTSLGAYIHEQVIWEETEVPYIIDSESKQITNGGVLVLGDDVAIKFAKNYRLSYQGNNLVRKDGNPVANSNNIFTSYNDDDVKGNTNDSIYINPAVNDWVGIYNCGTSSYETWDNIFYDQYAQNTH